ncbi:hypothetical protein K439DRAFT_1627566 [Ramaria rubella]|nr:hypothetical protein K439DRAFT_1627566 [Ramaria rubella]
MNVTLPALHNLFSESSLPSPSPSPSSSEDHVFTPIKGKDQFDQLYSSPHLPFPISKSKDVHSIHNRRVSTCSTSSAPSLTFSSSSTPSPPPTRPASPQSFLLVPCSLDIADAVVIIPESHPLTRRRNTSQSLPSSSATAYPYVPVLRPCKPSEARATLLIGPAISAHARRSTASGQRRIHPYRIVRERRL